MGNVSINKNEISRGLYGNVRFKKYIYFQHDEVLWFEVDLIHRLSLKQTFLCDLLGKMYPQIIFLNILF